MDFKFEFLRKHIITEVAGIRFNYMTFNISDVNARKEFEERKLRFDNSINFYILALVINAIYFIYQLCTILLREDDNNYFGISMSVWSIICFCLLWGFCIKRF